MNKSAACLAIVFVFSLVSFGTWQMFKGNLEAAFSSVPFLLILYVFLNRHRR